MLRNHYNPQVTLGISALLSMTVFLMTIRESLPPTEKTPLISELIKISYLVITDQWMWLFPGGTIYYRHSVGFPPKSHSAPLITLGGSLLPIHVTISLPSNTLCFLHNLSTAQWIKMIKFS